MVSRVKVVRAAAVGKVLVAVPRFVPGAAWLSGSGGRDDHRRVDIRRAGCVAARLHLHDGVVHLDSPRTRKTFGTSPEEAETTKLLAFNQGFYNLFLAIVAGLGIAAIAMGHKTVGATLVFTGVGSMAAAAVVLLLSAPDKARSALIQGTFPAIAVVLLVFGLM